MPITKNRFLLPAALLLAGVTGCASPSHENQPPKFTPSLLNADKQLCIARERSPSFYAIHQTTIATGGLVKDAIDSDNESNSSRLTAAGKSLNPNQNLYDAYYRRLASDLQSRGFTVEEVINAESPANTTSLGLSKCRSNWIFVVDSILIRYYAMTMLSSYKPQTNVMITPHNRQTSSSYHPIIVNASSSDSETTYALAQSITSDTERSLSNLYKTALEAASLTTTQIVGPTPPK